VLCRFAVAPFAGETPASELARLGAAFNHPLQTLTAAHHGGELPAAAQAVACAQPNVVVTQLKRAEDDDAVVLRLVELDGVATTARVALSREAIGAATAATETDLLERPLATNGAAASADGVSVALPAHGIATVKVAVRRG
jgi:alpha-mannosidase